MEELYEQLEEWEDKEIDAIAYGRHDLLPEIRAMKEKIRQKINEDFKLDNPQ